MQITSKLSQKDVLTDYQQCFNEGRVEFVVGPVMLWERVLSTAATGFRFGKSLNTFTSHGSVPLWSSEFTV